MAMTWPLAQDHDVSAGKPRVMRPAADNAANWPAGSIFSSAADLSRFAIAFLNGGRIDGKQALSPSLIEALSRPYIDVSGASVPKYGYGLTIVMRRGVRFVEHGGSRAAYGSFISMAPAERAAIVVVANRTGSSLPKTVMKAAEVMVPLLPERTPSPRAAVAMEPGETVSDAIAAVLSREPDWSELPAGVPPRIRTVLRRCLQKDQNKRLRDIGDVRLEIDEGADEALQPAAAVRAAVVAAVPAQRWPVGGLLVHRHWRTPDSRAAVPGDRRHA